ncbi:MAG: TrmB family transcriptional regulator [Candidatus Woesearchaeota archaeon]
MDVELKSFLNEFGLTNTESAIYLALLDMGKSLAGSIASKARIHRKNTYDALESLTQQGLVTHHIENNRNYYTALSPEKFREIIKEKLSRTENILPELLAKFNAVKPKSSVEVYQGINGIKSFNELMLKIKKPIFNIGATGKIFEQLKYSIPYYKQKSSTQKINAHFLTIHAIQENHINTLKNIKGVYVRRLPEKFATNTQIYIFGDYSAIQIWVDEPIAIVIKNRDIAKGFMEYFHYLWGKSKS